MNIWTRWLLLSPIALAIPISVDLAAARSTITKKISNNPTIIEKEPNIVNIVVTELPIFSANFNDLDSVSSTINLLS